MSNKGENPLPCESCGRPTRHDIVYITMWLGGELNIIEGVPAHVCDACGLQYYDPPIEEQIRGLAAAGFPNHLVTRTVSVPVFSLDVTDVNRPAVTKSA